MKKMKLALCASLAIAALSLTSCKNCVEQEIDVYKDAVEKVKDAKTKSDIKEIEKDVDTKVAKIVTSDIKEYAELSMLPENKSKIDAAEDEWEEALDKRKVELGIDPDDDDGGIFSLF